MATRLPVHRRPREDRLRLDTPGGAGRGRRANYDPDAFGRLTERVARFLGTGRYLVIQTAVVLVWMVYNAVPGLPPFDAYPYAFLTLVLSLQAAYAAPLILLAQNRQDDRDRANLVEDRGRAHRNLEDTEFLARELADVRLALGDVVTRDFLRSELRDLLAEIGPERAGDGGRGGPGGPGGKPRKARDKDQGKRKRRRERSGEGEEPLLVTEPQRPDTDEPAALDAPSAPAALDATSAPAAPDAPDAAGADAQGEGPVVR